MENKICKGCCEIFMDFIGNDYCNFCGAEIGLEEEGWLETKTIGGKNGNNK